MRVTRLSILLFLISLTAIHSARALEVPPLRGRVNDYAGLMPAARARALEERLARFEQETGHQVAVLTIPGLEGEDLEGFGLKVAESWKIGKKGFDNGAIFLIAKEDRKLRIEVGYGLEGVLPDAIASRIIREVVVPYFLANDFARGIEAGVEAIIKIASGEPLPEPARRRPGQNQTLFILFLLAIPIVAILSSLSQKRTHQAWSGAGRRYTGQGGPFWGGGGFGGGGFGGGGGFSGGGGGFGGGGASGSW